ncbi:hypothetical protein ScPMuIL_008522 [Solemya velum]
MKVTKYYCVLASLEHGNGAKTGSDAARGRLARIDTPTYTSNVCQITSRGLLNKDIHIKMSEKVTVAIFGLGRIGQIHLWNLLSNNQIRLKWIVEANTEHATFLLEERRVSRDIKVCGLSDLQTVLDDNSVQAVLICTPTDTHASLTIRALEAGKNVFCEKPLSEDTEEIRKCYDVAEQHGKVLMCAFNRHFDPAIRDIYQRVQKGELGKLHVIKCTFRDRPLWLGAHGLSQTFLVHDIDLSCWFAQGLPETVVCQASSNIKEVGEKNDVDTVAVILRFPSGTLAIIDFCRYSSYGYDVRWRYVYGEKGVLMADIPQTSTVKALTREGRREAPFCETFSDRFEEAYRAELDHFIKAMQGHPMEVKRIYSERVGIVTDAINESYRTGQVVYLNREK